MQSFLGGGLDCPGGHKSSMFFCNFVLSVMLVNDTICECIKVFELIDVLISFDRRSTSSIHC